MPQVPYTGASTVPLSENPTPTESINTPLASFGGDVAQATSHLGSAVAGAGDELFKRGMAMQELANHSEANLATADYMQKAGELHANFSSLQGKDAVDAYPDYIKSLKKLRSGIQDGLSNDMSRKLFETESLSTMGRTIFNGAGYAATQNKAYAIGSNEARIQAVRSAALAQPDDEHAFQAGLTLTEQQTRQKGQLEGKSEDAILNDIHQAQGKLWTDRITGLAKTQPFTAQKMLDDASKRGDITGEDLGRLTNVVQGAKNTVGARQISAEIRSGADLSFGSKVVSPSSARDAIGTYESGNNYGALGVEVPGRGRALGKYQVMPENLQPWLKQAGLPAMSEQEFLKSPSAQDKVFDTVFGQYMKDTGSFNDAAAKWFSGRTMAEAGNAKDQTGTSVQKYVSGTNALLAKNASLKDLVDRGTARAQEIAPNDVLLPDYVQQRVTSDYNQNLAIKRNDEFNNKQIVVSGILGGQDGKLPTTLEELKAKDPNIEKAWNDLNPTTQRQYLGYLAQNTKADNNWTPDRLRENQRLKGLAQSDPAAFIDEDIVGKNLPTSAKKSLMELQVKVKGNAEQDPRVTHALQVLRPMIEPAGLSRKTDTNGFDQFVGALQEALDVEQQDSKKPPTAEKIKEIGTRLLQEQSGTGWFGSSFGAQKMYQVSVPDKEADAIRKAYQQEKGAIPTDERIQEIYVRQLYRKLYSKPPKVADGGQ